MSTHKKLIKWRQIKEICQQYPDGVCYCERFYYGSGKKIPICSSRHCPLWEDLEPVTAKPSRPGNSALLAALKKTIAEIEKEQNEKVD
jgi:hypothetical protein